MTNATVLPLLEGHRWQPTVQVLDTVSSTNTLCKELAAQGAPAGTFLIADRQTGGRGRSGRSFHSPGGVGIYASVILRPTCAPAALSHLTAAAAVAVCDAVEEACSLRPGIKWTNDLVQEKRKLAGILTELSIEAGTVQYAVVGVGLNCNQTPEDFPEELRGMAGSIAQATGREVDRCALAAALVRHMSVLDETLFSRKEAYLTRYAADCVTIGKRVRIVRGDEERFALATGIDENAGLKVTYDDGTRDVVTSGEVSVRGMYGYL